MSKTRMPLYFGEGKPAKHPQNAGSKKKYRKIGWQYISLKELNSYVASIR